MPVSFPSNLTRKYVLWVTLFFLIFLTTGLVVFGNPDNALHRMALDHALSLFMWVVIGVILNATVDAAITTYFQRKEVT